MPVQTPNLDTPVHRCDPTRQPAQGKPPGGDHERRLGHHPVCQQRRRGTVSLMTSNELYSTHSSHKNMTVGEKKLSLNNYMKMVVIVLSMSLQGMETHHHGGQEKPSKYRLHICYSKHLCLSHHVRKYLVGIVVKLMGSILDFVFLYCVCSPNTFNINVFYENTQ